jgi:hypothetical protein
VPLGCFGLIVAGALFFTALFGIVVVSMRSSDVYREAVTRASANGAVLAELGAPIEAGLFVSGSIRTSGSSGSADMAIPLSGSRKEGTLHAVATKSAGHWTFSRLEVEVDGNPTPIPLLGAPAAP